MCLLLILSFCVSEGLNVTEIKISILLSTNPFFWCALRVLTSSFWILTGHVLVLKCENLILSIYFACMNVPTNFHFACSEFEGESDKEFNFTFQIPFYVVPFEYLPPVCFIR